MNDRRITGLARSQHEVVSLDQLRGIGIGRSAVRRRLHDGLLYCLFRGVYEFHRDRETFERDRAEAAKLRLAGRTFVAFTFRQVTGEPAWVLATTRRLLGAAARSNAASS